MNWLAHTLLSTRDVDYQLGNVLADPMRGKAWPEASAALKNGMKMHRAIDRFTDAHPLMAQSKARLGTQGYLKGVVLDLLCDHFLSQSWDQWATVGLDAYLSHFNRQAITAAVHFPHKPSRIITRLAETNLLGQYHSFSGFVRALERLDQRLSARLRAKETASQYAPQVAAQYDHLRTDFESFFPELMAFFKSHPLGSQDNHHFRQ